MLLNYISTRSLNICKHWDKNEFGNHFRIFSSRMIQSAESELTLLYILSREVMKPIMLFQEMLKAVSKLNSHALSFFLYFFTTAPLTLLFWMCNVHMILKFSLFFFNEGDFKHTFLFLHFLLRFSFKRFWNSLDLQI